jgi:hypothetical protein
MRAIRRRGTALHAAPSSLQAERKRGGFDATRCKFQIVDKDAGTSQARQFWHDGGSVLPVS